MASTLCFLCCLPLFATLCVLAEAALTLASHHGWEIKICLIEDGEHQHPGTSVRAKEAYYRELFLSLSYEQSQALFVSTGRRANINEVFLQWKSTLAKKFTTQTHGKHVVVLITRRTVTARNGDGGSGFALKGGMCTRDNIVLVKDDGSFSAVNLLAKLLVHSMGVDMDGVGAAGYCRNDEGHLMGTDLHLPLTFSHCTKRLLQEALRKHTCLKKVVSSNAAKTLPLPPLITRLAYCSALSLTHCDKLGMGSLASLTYEEKFCFIFCCKGMGPPEKMVAPDGLQCGKDVTGITDRRCINGECVQVE